MVVEPAVLDEPVPLIPAWRDVLAIVLVQELPIVGCPLQVGDEGHILVVLHPVEGAAVFVDSLLMVVVYLKA